MRTFLEAALRSAPHAPPHVGRARHKEDSNSHFEGTRRGRAQRIDRVTQRCQRAGRRVVRCRARAGRPSRAGRGVGRAIAIAAGQRLRRGGCRLGEQQGGDGDGAYGDGNGVTAAEGPREAGRRLGLGELACVATCEALLEGERADCLAQLREAREYEGGLERR